MRQSAHKFNLFRLSTVVDATSQLVMLLWSGSSNFLVTHFAEVKDSINKYCIFQTGERVPPQFIKHWVIAPRILFMEHHGESTKSAGAGAAAVKCNDESRQWSSSSTSELTAVRGQGSISKYGIPNTNPKNRRQTAEQTIE